MWTTVIPTNQKSHVLAVLAGFWTVEIRYYRQLEMVFKCSVNTCFPLFFFLQHTLIERSIFVCVKESSLTVEVLTSSFMGSLGGLNSS